MIEFIFASFCIACVIGFAWFSMHQLEKERAEWNAERSKLLDRIQSGSFTEYKAQERANIPRTHKQIDPTKSALEKERWL